MPLVRQIEDNKPILEFFARRRAHRGGAPGWRVIRNYRVRLPSPIERRHKRQYIWQQQAWRGGARRYTVGVCGRSNAAASQWRRASRAKEKANGVAVSRHRAGSASISKRVPSGPKLPESNPLRNNARPSLAHRKPIAANFRSTESGFSAGRGLLRQLYKMSAVRGVRMRAHPDP